MDTKPPIFLAGLAVKLNLKEHWKSIVSYTSRTMDFAQSLLSASIGKLLH